MRSCDLCARGTGVMQKHSHSQVKHKTHQKVNVQTKRLDGGSVRLCSKCLKTINKMEKEIVAKQTAKKA
ncbi:MAG TPA: bL28 family ribosomal protein [bacterium]|nr:50S ribosomal protein L28 [Patescibacteria group bacterium]HPO11472.1 bL28 family ribosomal protein [bacterium]